MEWVWDTEKICCENSTTCIKTPWVTLLSTGSDGSHFACDSSGGISQIGVFRNDIPILKTLRSDQIFRASTGLWLLRKYSSDPFQSIAVISFVSSTILLFINENDGHFIERSELFGLRTDEQTIEIANSYMGSFLVQVCPQTIVICRSNVSEELAGLELAKFDIPSEERITNAVILQDYVFTLDVPNNYASIYKCHVGRGTSSITKIITFSVQSDASCIAVMALSDKVEDNLQSPTTPRTFQAKASKKFLIVVASSAGLLFWMIVLSENAANVTQLGAPHSFKSNDGISDVMTVAIGDTSYIFCGLRDGSCQVYRFSFVVDQLQLELIDEITTGPRPVKFLRDWDFTGGSVLILSGHLFLLKISENGAAVEKLQVKADFLANWVDKEPSRSKYLTHKFLAIEHEALLIFYSSMRSISRIDFFAQMNDCRFLVTEQERNILYSIGLASSIPRKGGGNGEQDAVWDLSAYMIASSSSQEVELLARMSISIDGSINSVKAIHGEYIALGLRINDVGQLKVFRTPAILGSTNKSRRQSATSSPAIQKTHNVTHQLNLITQVAFPQPVDIVEPINKDTPLLIVASGFEVHLLKLNGSHIEFLHTETWRSKIVALKSNSNSLVAIFCQIGALQIFKIEDTGEWVKLWGFSRQNMVDTIDWISESVLVVTNRYGIVNWISVKDDGRVERISSSMARDIIISVAPLKNGTGILCYGISGNYHFLTNPFQ